MKSAACETGISDYHKMIVTLLKSTFAKGKPKTINYRDFNNFDKDLFEETRTENSSNNDISFQNIFTIPRDTLHQ